jgi:proteasome accessory factor A
MGTETEYGIAAAGQPDFNPVLSSSMLISSYAGSLRKIRWDYEDESPMRDARGFEPQPGREMSDEDLGLANVILPNGARYYVDHAHPEYSTPECLSPRDLVVHDKAGERILERSLEVVAADMPQAPRLSVYKNNSDGKGNSYGTHENYLVDRATPFADIVRDHPSSSAVRCSPAREGGIRGQLGRPRHAGLPADSAPTSSRPGPRPR